ncbi:hypothetical protein C8R45DRAFT_255193 [Mycena sanguinolenta]|nr:hypothetical protein C8R45DRAFT_255193 [Mycena sanguinolenta]
MREYGPSPSLETLTMRGDGCFLRFTLDLLRVAPNLIEYLIYDTDIFFFSVHVEQVVLPKLRRLTFGNPVLKIDSPSGVLLGFLKQSSPPLLELTRSLKVRDDAIDFVALDEYVPGLRRLKVWFPEYSVRESLFSALASQSLLHRLHTLAIHIDRHDLPESCTGFWNALVRALAACRA